MDSKAFKARCKPIMERTGDNPRDPFNLAPLIHKYMKTIRKRYRMESDIEVKQEYDVSRKAQALQDRVKHVGSRMEIIKQVADGHSPSRSETRSYQMVSFSKPPICL